MDDDESADAKTIGQRAAKARELTIFARWSNGRRLNVSELREIRRMIGEENYVRAIDLLGVSVADAERAPGFAGTDRTSYAFEYPHYVPIVGRGVRQIKRWVKIGREATENGIPKPDLPPLDEPWKLHAWWVRHMTQRPPQKIVQLALAGERRDGSPTPNETTANEARSIDVSQINIAEGDELRQARSFLAAVAQLLAAAYKAGEDSEIDRLQRRWVAAMNARRLAAASERAAKKEAGELVPIAELFPELSQLLVTVRVMRATMSRRIRARLLLPPELDAKLDEVIELERRGEESVLRRLSVFRNMAEVEAELELVA